MKFETTRKAILNSYSYNKIFSAGYCELQALLAYESPIAYTTGIYGWNFDLYLIKSVAICTGYRGMPGKRIPYGRVKTIEERARAIDVDATIDDKRAARAELLKEFIRELRHE